jgi:hypothetical protein
MTAPSAPEPGWAFEGTDPKNLLGRGKEPDDDERGRFFLSLALVYNDLKGLAYFCGLAKRDGERPPGEVSPEAAEQNGVQLQITRYLIGVLHELLKLLKASEAIVRSAKVVALTSRMPTEARKDWMAVVDVALGGPGQPTTGLAKLLLLVRNNFSFHYDQPKNLAKGYAQAFFVDPAPPGRDKAYFALGRTMEFTRFFYADGAAQAGVIDWGEKTSVENLTDEVTKLASKVNVALRFLVGGFVESRIGRRRVI